MRYVVQWHEKITGWAEVDAGSESEALSKAQRGDYVEGTQDSEPGARDPRSYRVIRSFRVIDVNTSE